MKARTLVQAFALLFLASACNTPGICKTDADCNEFGVICYAGTNPKKGAKGICTEGERLSTGEIVAAVRTWRLVLPTAGESAITPLLWDKRDVALGAAAAGWTGASGAVVEAEVLGLKSGEAVEVKTGHGLEAECKLQGPIEGARGELWRCVFESGWNLAKSGWEAMETAETVEVKLKPGALAEERSRTYRVDVQPPLVGLVVSAGTKCTVGSTGTCPAGQSCTAIGGSPQPGVNSNTQNGAPGFCAGSSGVPVRVCAQAKDTQSGLRSFKPNSPIVSRKFLGEPLKEEVHWTYDEENAAATPSSACWSGTLPLLETNGADTFYFSMTPKASDAAGNLFESTIHGSLERISCNALVVDGLSLDAVRAPLAYSNDQLLFGTSMGTGATAANNSLYFFDAEGCALNLNSPLHTGALQGPMVAMGGSGKVAVALGEGGPTERPGPRLAVVNAEGFVDDAENCIPGAWEIHGGAVFDRGLSLLSKGNANGTDGSENNAWRFAAPANSEEENTSRLVAYAPNVKWPGGQCKAECPDREHPQVAKGRFTLPPVYYLDFAEDGEYSYDVAAMKEATKEGLGWMLNAWGFNYNHLLFLYPGTERLSLVFGIDLLANTHYPEHYMPNPSGMAVEAYENEHGKYEDIWLSGDGLWRIAPGYEDAFQILNNRWRTSPAAVDEKGRTYVVVATDSGYEIQRFSAECSVGDNTCADREECLAYNGHTEYDHPGICRKKSEYTFKESPVGSPILGESATGGPAEIYVVSTAGTVRALNAETLQPLWVQSLGMRVLPTAQPVLVPNAHGGGTLWVVGAQGEVRGVRVASRGLNKKAGWPKAFHDNCNTSSSAVKAADMPSCF